MRISTRPPGHLWGVPALQTLSTGPRAWLQPVALTDADLVCAGATHIVRGCLCAHGTDRVRCGVDGTPSPLDLRASPSRHHTHSRSRLPCPCWGTRRTPRGLEPR